MYLFIICLFIYLFIYLFLALARTKDLKAFKRLALKFPVSCFFLNKSVLAVTKAGIIKKVIFLPLFSKLVNIFYANYKIIPPNDELLDITLSTRCHIPFAGVKLMETSGNGSQVITPNSVQLLF